MRPTAPSLAGIILAAGASTRMGLQKALLPYPAALAAHAAGSAPAAPNFLLACAYKLLAVCPALWIVLPPGQAGAELRAACSLAASAWPVDWLENPAPERGQFSSLQIAAAAVLADLRWAGAVVVPVDRPMFAPTTLAALAAALAAAQEAAVLKPAHAGCHGHPVLYGRAFLAVIAAAPADATAREVARPWAARTLAVAVADPGVLINVDTPEDYRRIAAHRP